MKVLLIAIGTRGDIEPFLAIAELLDKKGHEVICCFPEQFREITHDSNFRFEGLTPDFLKMLESEEGKIAMGGKANLLKKIKSYFFLYKQTAIINKIICKQQHELIHNEQPDKIIYHIKSIYPLIHETQNPGKTVLVSPIPYMVHPVKEHAHIGFKNMGNIINKFSYKLANQGLLKSVKDASKSLYNTSSITPKNILTALNQTKTVYSISPYLFDQPNYWPKNVRILGYHERVKTLNWKPDESLLKFLDQHEQLAFVSFGSMVNAEPEKNTQTILAVLEKLNLPAIINTGEGGLTEPDSYNNKLFYFVSRIPYEWLLPQIDYMIHHGGSGTTHMAMKYGVPSVIIPHIIDQFLWNDINNKKGLGPKGIPITKLKESNLKQLIIDLNTNKTYKTTAKEASESIQKENFKEDLYEFIIN